MARGGGGALSQFEFVPQDTEKFEFLHVMDFGGVANSVQTVVYTWANKTWANQIVVSFVGLF